MSVPVVSDLRELILCDHAALNRHCRNHSGELELLSHSSAVVVLALTRRASAAEGQPSLSRGSPLAVRGRTASHERSGESANWSTRRHHDIAGTNCGASTIRLRMRGETRAGAAVRWLRRSKLGQTRRMMGSYYSRTLHAAAGDSCGTCQQGRETRKRRVRNLQRVLAHVRTL
jgi:hypothetical protein